MSTFSESIKLNNGNVLDTESSAIESLSSNLYNAIHNNMNSTSLFTNQNGGAAPTTVGRKKTSRGVAQKTARPGSRGSKAGSKKGSKKAGSKKGSKKAGSKKGSKKAGSKRGSKKAGSKKAGSKKAGSKKGSKRAYKNEQNIDMVGGRKSKKSSRSRSTHSVDSNIMSDSIESFINSNTKSNTKSAQDGGKKGSKGKGSKKGSKKSSSKRQLPEKLQEFQKLIKHLSSSGLKHGPVLFTLAKNIRTEIMKDKSNANIPTKELTTKAMKLYDGDKKRWAAEYEKIKVDREKTKGMKKK
jgi:hypothetical protein